MSLLLSLIVWNSFLCRYSSSRHTHPGPSGTTECAFVFAGWGLHSPLRVSGWCRGLIGSDCKSWYYGHRRWIWGKVCHWCKKNVTIPVHDCWWPSPVKPQLWNLSVAGCPWWRWISVCNPHLMKLEDRAKLAVFCVCQKATLLVGLLVMWLYVYWSLTLISYATI